MTDTTDTVVLVDGDGDFYAVAVALLDAPHAVTTEQIEAARLDDVTKAAVQMALSYERVGQACGPALASGDVVLLGERAFSVLGTIGAS